MDGPTAAEVGTYEEDLKQVLSGSDDADAMDGGYELPVIVVDDPGWHCQVGWGPS